MTSSAGLPRRDHPAHDHLAHHRALELTRTVPAEIEYWPTLDPTAVEGNREQRLDAYREVRDQLTARIRERFGQASRGNE